MNLLEDLFVNKELFFGVLTKENTVYSLYSYDINDDKNIIIIDKIPEGPLKLYVNTKTFINDNNSLYFVFHPNYDRSMMKEGEILILYNFLIENGYIIETEQYYKNNLYDNKKLIFRFFYNKNNNLLK
jgi:hypothetical protein